MSRDLLPVDQQVQCMVVLFGSLEVVQQYHVHNTVAFLVSSV